MILTKEVEVNIGNKNIKYFKNLGYKIDGKILKVKVEDLLPTTSVRVNVICDFCGKEYETLYKNYYYNFNSNNLNLFSCSPKCTSEKTKINVFKKYGVYYANQSNIVKNKTKENSIKNLIHFDKNILLKNPDYMKYIETKEVIVTINKWNINHFEKLGYKNLKLNQKWQIPTEHLMSKSSIRVDCICSVCSRKVNLSFQKLTTNYNRGKFYSCTNCNNKMYKISMINKYGVENCLQNKEVFDKGQKSGFKIKEYKGMSYQGTYELDFLKFCDSNNLLNDISKINPIKYTFKNKTKYYHSDFYLKKYNMIIEIKSSYYYNRFLEKNLSKEESCINSGYDFLFIIDKNYDNFKQKITQP